MPASFSQEFAIDTVYFAFDRDDVQPEYAAQLDSLILKFKDYPSYYVEITGHTDSIGSEAYNQQLSERRALSVYSYLVEQGLHPNRMSYEGFGTQRPVAPNSSFIGRSKNRRADMAVVFSTEPLGEPIAEGEGSGEAPQPVQEPDIDPKVPVEQAAGFDAVSVDPRALNVITTAQGTRVTIPAGVFDTDETEVNITVRELFNKSDIILFQMPSMANDGPLETAGMVEIDARTGRRNRPVRLKRGMAIKVEVPTTRRDPNMGVYLGTGGSRGSSRGQSNQRIAPINPVQTWRELPEVSVGYGGNKYTFQAPSLDRFSIARPLYYSQDTDPEGAGIDFKVKVKGNVAERNTSVMLVGEVVRTFIPLSKRSKRLYEADELKYLDDETKLILVVISYQDDVPYFSKREFKVANYLKKRRKGPGKIKLKARLRRLKDFNELEERIRDL